MTTKKNAQSDWKYLDIQAYVGITKHNGGLAATNELLSLCHIEDAQEVLDVGCGIGVGPAYIAKKHHCRVVGVDVSEKMIEWSRQRASEQKVVGKVELQTASVLELPFDADRFDCVIVESVIAFVQDKRKAIRECVRVAKPGGYVGLNESFWFTEPSPEIVAQVQALVGTDVPTAATWQTLWEGSELRDRVVRIRQLDPRTEIKDRIQWVGWRWAARAWGRLLRLFVTRPPARQSIKEMFATPLPVGVIQQMGYGLYVGRKWSANAIETQSQSMPTDLLRTPVHS